MTKGFKGVKMAKRCMAGGCYEIVRDGTARCEKHTKSKKIDNNKLRSRSDNKITRKIYDTQRWRRLSKRLRQQYPLCVLCLAKGINSITTCVDHIIELKDTTKHAYDLSNLQCICDSCHQKKTADERKTRQT